MMKRVITLALSVLLFAIILSWISYVPSSQRELNVYYFGFFETFIFVIIYAGPIYFLFGLPVSIFIENLIEKSKRKSKWAKYFVGLGLYSLFGILAGIIFLIILSQSGNLYPSEIFFSSIYGIIASNLYFHLALLVSKINNK